MGGPLPKQVQQDSRGCWFTLPVAGMQGYQGRSPWLVSRSGSFGLSSHQPQEYSEDVSHGGVLELPPSLHLSLSWCRCDVSCQSVQMSNPWVCCGEPYRDVPAPPQSSWAVNGPVNPNSRTAHVRRSIATRSSS